MKALDASREFRVRRHTFSRASGCDIVFDGDVQQRAGWTSCRWWWEDERRVGLTEGGSKNIWDSVGNIRKGRGRLRRGKYQRDRLTAARRRLVLLSFFEVRSLSNRNFTPGSSQIPFFDGWGSGQASRGAVRDDGAPQPTLISSQLSTASAINYICSDDQGRTLSAGTYPAQNNWYHMYFRPRILPS